MRTLSWRVAGDLLMALVETIPVSTSPLVKSVFAKGELLKSLILPNLAIEVTRIFED